MIVQLIDMHNNNTIADKWPSVLTDPFVFAIWLHIFGQDFVFFFKCIAVLHFFLDLGLSSTKKSLIQYIVPKTTISLDILKWIIFLSITNIDVLIIKLFQRFY